jgi:glycosyltransferase involved in cell wall biosynthesis
VLNFNNPYSASHALNIGLEKAKGDIVVFCHQDVIFYKEWIDMLYERIRELEAKDKNWGVLGTAGIDQK